MNETILWLILLILCIVIELGTLGLTTIWFAGGAFVAVVASIFGAPLYLQIILFLVISFVLLFFTRPIAVKYFNKDRVKTNVESMIGCQAIVISEIDNLQGIGRVTVKGQEWSAKTVEDGMSLPVGAVVEVLAVSGVKLIVEERKEGK